MIAVNSIIRQTKVIIHFSLFEKQQIIVANLRTILWRRRGSRGVLEATALALVSEDRLVYWYRINLEMVEEVRYEQMRHFPNIKKELEITLHSMPSSRKRWKTYFRDHIKQSIKSTMTILESTNQLRKALTRIWSHNLWTSKTKETKIWPLFRLPKPKSGQQMTTLGIPWM